MQTVDNELASSIDALEQDPEEEVVFVVDQSEFESDYEVD